MGYPAASFYLAILLVLQGCSLGPSAAAPLPVAEEGEYRLTAYFTGLPNEETSIRVALYRDKAHWLSQTHVFKARLLLSTKTEAALTFYGLPAGTYAIAAYQDQNHNGRLDRWFGLIPREPVAVSQVATFRRPPTFEQSAVKVPAQTRVNIAFRGRTNQ